MRTMAQRKPKRSASHMSLSSRQWAWEFLRFNAKYRNAYAAWLAIPDSVRNFMAILTLPSKNVSLVECLNSDKENGNDECETGTLHA